MLTIMEPLNALEATAIRTFCKIAGLPIDDLADHIPYLSVSNRTYTGVGIFVDLNSSFNGGGVGDATISGVHAVTSDTRPALGFLLFVEAGKPAMLEGFSYTNEWPDDLSDYIFSIE